MSFAVTGMLHLFICPPHASVLSRHLAFKAHSFGLPLHSPCHVLQMAIVLITCDAYSPVCLLYQLVLLLLFFFFFFFFLPFLFLFFFFHTKYSWASQQYQRSTTSQHHSIWGYPSS
jgi:hypothetical protein